MAGAQFAASSGRIGQGDPDEAVGAELQHDCGQEHRPDRWGGGVGVGQPGVERPHRHLDRKPEEHRPEDQQGEPPGEGPGGCPSSVSCGDVEGALTRLTGLEVEGEETQQHERRAEQREQEELDRGVEPGLDLAAEAGDLPQRAGHPRSRS